MTVSKPTILRGFFMAIQQSYFCEVCTAKIEPTGGGVFIGGTAADPVVVGHPSLGKVHLCRRCVLLIEAAASGETMMVP